MQPSWDEVEAQVEKSASYLLSTKYKDRSQSIKEELKQEAYLRVWSKFDSIDADKGWKSFVQLHVKGAMQDYFKKGSAHHEDKTGGTKLRFRVRLIDSDGDELGLDDILGHYGIHSEEHDFNKLDIKWDLLAKIASRDSRVYILAKRLLGFSVEEIAKETDYSREWVGKKQAELFEAFDSPMNKGDKCIDQIIYAFGLSHIYGTPNVDIGWCDDLTPVDFFDKKDIKNKKFTSQIEMFQ